MLETLKKIGDQLLEGQGVWAQLTTEPRYSKDRNKKNWVCPILFDCVNNEIRILKNELELFRPEESSIQFRYISTGIWGPRGKKCALTIEPQKFSMLEETLFGKDGKELGNMAEAIKDFDPELKYSPLFRALEEIFEKLYSQREILDLNGIQDDVDLGKQEEIVLFYSVIKSQEIDNGHLTKMTALDGYDEFIIGKFATHNDAEPGLNYVNGKVSDEVIEANFSGRYNIHKIFQTTASNYAARFSKKNFRNNFQLNPETIAALDRASEYVLENLQTRIAGVSHIVIPNFLSKDLDLFDVKETEFFLDKSADLLFRLTALSTSTERDLPETNLFWVNYLAYESDGNSFKVINHIKDVNSLYIQKLIRIFHQVGLEFRDYIAGKYNFNLQSVYYIIPVRDPQKKSKLNPALLLIKTILEQRTVSDNQLFEHFIKLILCYRYGRYSGFINIKESKSFDFAVKDAVFKYSALIYALRELDLTDLEKPEGKIMNANEHSESDMKQRIENFFQKMDYQDGEQAMFYLGRVLSSVANAQYKKGHESKPVLNKINFNGMDAQAVLRLSLDLAEKTRQYNIHNKTELDFARFRERFNERDWTLTKEKSVFYLMVGYSFGLIKNTKN